MLESGKVKSLKEIAERENIDNSYVSRPIFVTTILEDEAPDDIALFELAVILRH